MERTNVMNFGPPSPLEIIDIDGSTTSKVEWRVHNSPDIEYNSQREGLTDAASPQKKIQTSEPTDIHDSERNSFINGWTDAASPNEKITERTSHKKLEMKHTAVKRKSVQISEPSHIDDINEKIPPFHKRSIKQHGAFVKKQLKRLVSQTRVSGLGRFISQRGLDNETQADDFDGAANKYFVLSYFDTQTLHFSIHDYVLTAGVNAMAIICALVITIPYQLLCSLNMEYLTFLKKSIAVCPHQKTYGMDYFQVYHSYILCLLTSIFASICGKK